MLNMSLKIEQSQISRRIWGFTLLMCLFMLIYSCDTCDISGSDGGNSDEKIYYTAISSNNLIPDIYSINKNGTEIKKIISDGIVFSSPSINRQICFMRKNIQGIGELYLYDSDNNIFHLITKSTFVDIAFPVLSSDGSKIAFNAADGRLLINKDIANPIFDQISGKLLSGNIPSFSPDSKKLAYFEKISNQTIAVKVIDAENTANIITLFSKDFDGSILSEEGNVSINWSKDSKAIIFSVQIDGKSVLYIINIETQNEVKFSFDTFTFNQPAISPDSKFAVFSNIDGNLWIINIDNTDVSFSRITNNKDGSKCFNPLWSSDGKSICYNMVSDFSNGLYTNLMLAEVEIKGSNVKPKLIMILSNNVYKGFWR
jgi:Tol biopolymer transport system component